MRCTGLAVEGPRYDCLAKPVGPVVGSVGIGKVRPSSGSSKGRVSLSSGQMILLVGPMNKLRAARRLRHSKVTRVDGIAVALVSVGMIVGVLAIDDSTCIFCCCRKIRLRKFIVGSISVIFLQVRVF